LPRSASGPDTIVSDWIQRVVSMPSAIVVAMPSLTFSEALTMTVPFNNKNSAKEMRKITNVKVPPTRYDIAGGTEADIYPWDLITVCCMDFSTSQLRCEARVFYEGQPDPTFASLASPVAAKDHPAITQTEKDCAAGGLGACIIAGARGALAVGKSAADFLPEAGRLAGYLSYGVGAM